MDRRRLAVRSTLVTAVSPQQLRSSGVWLSS